MGCLPHVGKSSLALPRIDTSILRFAAVEKSFPSGGAVSRYSEPQVYIKRAVIAACLSWRLEFVRLRLKALLLIEAIALTAGLKLVRVVTQDLVDALVAREIQAGVH